MAAKMPPQVSWRHFIVPRFYRRANITRFDILIREDYIVFAEILSIALHRPVFAGHRLSWPTMTVIEVLFTLYWRRTNARSFLGMPCAPSVLKQYRYMGAMNTAK